MQRFEANYLKSTQRSRLFVASLETMFYHANSDVISERKYFRVLSYGLSKIVGEGNIGGREIQTGGHGPTETKIATFGGHVQQRHILVCRNVQIVRHRGQEFNVQI